MALTKHQIDGLREAGFVSLDEVEAEYTPQIRSALDALDLAMALQNDAVPSLRDFLLDGGLQPSLPVADETIDRMFQRGGVPLAPRNVLDADESADHPKLSDFPRV
jgi:hypothetical protein